MSAWWPGAAGRVLGDLPSANGINGSVSNVHAQNIMSMVAGSVDQVDFIQKLTELQVPTAASSAAIKRSPSSRNSRPQSGDPGLRERGGRADALPVAPAAGGILIDGAFVAKNIRDIKSARDFQGTLVE